MRELFNRHVEKYDPGAVLNIDDTDPQQPNPKLWILENCKYFLKNGK